MPAYLAKIRVTLKNTVNDPQGQTVLGALRSLGFSTVESVRVGKYLEIRLEAASQEAAQTQVQEMCRKLLANPVIEQYSFELEGVSQGVPTR
jgi:phosphoribosylformylglycinamidine synthase